MQRYKPRWVPMLFIPALLALALGLLSGLARLGIQVPQQAALQAGWHGALMLSAFFGTLISLERAVALGRAWVYLAPAASGLAGLSLLFGWFFWPPLLTVLAAGVLTLASWQVYRKQPALFLSVLATAALCWLIGAVLWALTGDLQQAVAWWLAFLVLTIAGERLELSRLRPKSQTAQALFVGLTAALLTGAGVAGLEASFGLRLFAAALIGLSGWMLVFDIARHTVKQRGLTRLIALCLLSGYVWLALAGALGLFGGFEPGHGLRDAAMHALALGFVFSMVFGHAPIIVPALTGLGVPYHPAFYLAPIALQTTLLARTFAALAGNWELRQLAAIGNSLALLLFILLLVWRLGVGLRQKRLRGDRP